MSLAIVIPYRDRPESVRRLVPALAAYLAQRHPGMTAALYVVEQEPGKPFNRGMIANVGFVLGQGDGHDQFCFHDVDYLPLDADYSPVPGPTRLIWTGLERPQPYDRFFGAVVAFPAADFVRVGGYTNDFWGWANDDEEIRLRCLAAGLTLGFRDGVFRVMPHRHGAVDETGRWLPEALRNRAMFAIRARRFASDGRMPGDDLDRLRFAMLDAPSWLAPPPGVALRHVRVAI